MDFAVAYRLHKFSPQIFLYHDAFYRKSISEPQKYHTKIVFKFHL